MRCLAAVACASLLLGGCAARSVYRPAVTPLDQGIVFVEQDENGGRHPIGAVRPDAGHADSVAVLEGVDDNSAVHIMPKPGVLGSASGGAADTSQIHELAVRAQRLREAVDAMTDYLSARAGAIQHFGAMEAAPEGAARDSARARFRAQRRRFDGLELEQMNRLQEAFAHSTDEITVDSLVGKLGEDARPLTDFLRRRLTGLEAELAALRSRVASSSYHLRLEAFLLSRKSGRRTAIHLENYDDIAAGELNRHDPAGLDLSPQEREQLRELMKQSEALASALESLRQGQGTLEEVLSTIAPEATRRMVQLAQSADSLRQQLAAEPLARRWDGLKTAAAKLAADVRDAFGASVSSRAKEAFAKAQESLKQSFESHSNWVDVLNLAVQLRSLRAPGATAVDLTDWVTSVSSTYKALGPPRQVLQELRDEVDGVLEDVEAQLDALPAEVRGEMIELWKTSDLHARLEAAAALVRRADEITAELRELCGELRQQPDLAPVPGGQPFEVPLDQLKDTALEIQRTPRIARDEFEIRASLLKGGKVVEQTMTVLRVERYGLRRELRPAVVMATPDRLAGDGEARRYTTSLSYLLTYRPRPDAHATADALWRSLRPEAGPHAIFLNFSPKEQRDFGFGLTVGLFDGIVQGGMGWNPFVSRADEGQVYYFFGSNLFGLLQEIGLHDVASEE